MVRGRRWRECKDCGEKLIHPDADDGETSCLACKSRECPECEREWMGHDDPDCGTWQWEQDVPVLCPRCRYRIAKHKCPICGLALLKHNRLDGWWQCSACGHETKEDR